MGFIEYILLAFVGGIILNIMPCVLPVLTLKAFHVVDSLRADPSGARLHGLAYAAGTTLTFALFGVVVILLRESGKTLGWGMQFQHPPFVAALVIAIFAFGLNALGVFEITLGVRGGHDSKGLLGSVTNGALAAVMSTPCTAPFLGSAAAFAMGSGAAAWQTLALFVFIGLGLAAPFTAFSFVPALIKVLPKPGPWMNVFKKLMGFTLLATAVWLFGAFQAQVTPSSANMMLAFMLLMAVALWAMQEFGNITHTVVRRWGVRGAGFAAMGLFWVGVVDFERPAAKVPVLAEATGDHVAVKDGHINWLDFAPPAVKAARDRKQSVLVDYTADWCASCKTLEKVAIETDGVRGAIRDTGVLPMRADWTNENETIEKWLADVGRNAIPTVVIYKPDGTYHLMPEVFTEDQLVQALQSHGKGG
jgi:thiol:disulfide interchange protein